MVLEIDEIISQAAGKGISANELFKLAGVAPVTLWRYRTGKFQPRLETLHKLMKALNA